MSFNLYLSATLKDNPFDDFDDEDRTEECYLYQTPTEVTLKILENKSNDEIFKAYSEWILTIFENKDHAKEHIDHVKNWLEHYQGREIEWYYM